MCKDLIMTTFLTTGKIAKQLDVDRDAVAYALRKLRISPIGRAGLARIYDKTCIAAIETFLNNKHRKAAI